MNVKVDKVLIHEDPLYLKIESMNLQTGSNGFKIELTLRSNPRAKNIKDIVPNFLLMEMNNVNVQFLTLMLNWMKESNASLDRQGMSQLEFEALVYPFVIRS